MPGSGQRDVGWLLLHCLWVLPTLLFVLATWVSSGLILLLVVWAAGIIHALWVNFTTRLPLLAAGRERAPGVP